MSGVYLLCLFDVSTNTKLDRHNYNDFRKYILKQGFLRFQLSVYYKYMSSINVAKEYELKIKRNTTMINGVVTLVIISKKQFQTRKTFGKYHIHGNRNSVKVEQLSLL